MIHIDPLNSTIEQTTGGERCNSPRSVVENVNLQYQVPYLLPSSSNAPESQIIIHTSQSSFNLTTKHARLLNSGNPFVGSDNDLTGDDGDDNPIPAIFCPVVNVSTRNRGETISYSNLSNHTLGSLLRAEHRS